MPQLVTTVRTNDATDCSGRARLGPLLLLAQRGRRGRLEPVRRGKELLFLGVVLIHAPPGGAVMILGRELHGATHQRAHLHLDVLEPRIELIARTGMAALDE